jgi:hypothetical protein
MVDGESIQSSVSQNGLVLRMTHRKVGSIFQLEYLQKQASQNKGNFHSGGVKRPVFDFTPRGALYPLQVKLSPRSEDPLFAPLFF